MILEVRACFTSRLTHPPQTVTNRTIHHFAEALGQGMRALDDLRDARTVFFQDLERHWHELRWTGLPAEGEAPSSTTPA